MGRYEVHLFVSLLGSGMKTMLAHFHVWGIMFLLRAVLNILVRNASPRGPMFLGAWYLVYQDLVSCYFCFVLLPIGHEKWRVLYPCMLCVALFMCLFVLCFACLTVFGIVWWNNSQYVWVCLLFCCWMWWNCCVLLEVLYWIDHVWSSIECVCCGSGPSERLDAPSMFVCVFECRKLSPHLGVWELDHMGLLFLCCLFVWFCILCLRVRACNCYASFPLVCCACLPLCLWKLCWQCVYWWVWWSEQKWTVFSVNCVQSTFL